jgi:uncharacterized cupin superfamily protein
MKSGILNIEELSYQKWSRASSVRAEIGWVGAALGSRKLGFNVTAVPPGESAFPYHVTHLTPVHAPMP